MGDRDGRRQRGVGPLVVTAIGDDQRILRGEQPQAQIEAQVDVPAAIYEWKALPEKRDAARALQAANATALDAAFARGLAVLGYRRNEQGDGSFLLGKWDEEFLY